MIAILSFLFLFSAYTGCSLESFDFGVFAKLAFKKITAFITDYLLVFWCGWGREEAGPWEREVAVLGE